MFDNDIIILDEPTVGLDPIALIRLKELISSERDKGKTIIITTHIMDVVEELADTIVFLLEGKIYFKGSLKDMYEITNEVKLERSIAKILEKNKENQISQNVIA
jgi:Cu-processing system ATP-binding protein